MEGDTHYIPSIEEFHVGFAYEFKSKNGWVKNNIENSNVDFIFQLNMFKDLENYRVKYLDREDIESLGWYVHENGGFALDLKNRTIHLWRNLVGPNIVEIYENPYSKENYKVCIPSCMFSMKLVKDQVMSETVEFMPLVFKGVVKNKSEFKKLMQQLNITE